ncbi:hypothetical protein EV122DRAFT_256296 [Schizophyllum commune]
MSSPNVRDKCFATQVPVCSFEFSDVQYGLMKKKEQHVANKDDKENRTVTVSNMLANFVEALRWLDQLSVYDRISSADACVASHVDRFISLRPFQALENLPPQEAPAELHCATSAASSVANALQLLSISICIRTVRDNARYRQSISSAWPSIYTWMDYILPLSHRVDDETLQSRPIQPRMMLEHVICILQNVATDPVLLKNLSERHLRVEETILYLSAGHLGQLIRQRRRSLFSSGHSLYSRRIIIRSFVAFYAIVTTTLNSGETRDAAGVTILRSFGNRLRRVYHAIALYGFALWERNFIWIGRARHVQEMLAALLLVMDTPGLALDHYPGKLTISLVLLGIRFTEDAIFESLMHVMFRILDGDRRAVRTAVKAGILVFMRDRMGREHNVENTPVLLSLARFLVDPRDNDCFRSSYLRTPWETHQCADLVKLLNSAQRCTELVNLRNHQWPYVQNCADSELITWASNETVPLRNSSVLLAGLPKVTLAPRSSAGLPFETMGEISFKAVSARYVHLMSKYAKSMVRRLGKSHIRTRSPTSCVSIDLTQLEPTFMEMQLPPTFRHDPLDVKIVVVLRPTNPGSDVSLTSRSTRGL